MTERIIKAGEFKARCLQLMDEVASTGETIVVTKRGKPMARLVPMVPHRTKGPKFGFYKELAAITPDDALASPWDDDLEAALADGLERTAALINDPEQKR
jgi:prevent-host-death family protein